MNPRRRRHRRSRRRNPGFGGAIRKVFVPYAAGFITSIGCSLIDSRLANYPAGKQLVKVGGAIAIAMFGRRYPVASAAAIGALAASQGYVVGTRLAGGLVAHTPAQAVQGLGEMQQTYPELGALLSGGVGALLSGMGGPDDVDAVAANYTTALNNMSGDDE